MDRQNRCRVQFLAMAIGLGLSACAVPPKSSFPDCRTAGGRPSERTPIDPRAEALAWFGADSAVKRAQAAGSDLSPSPAASTPTNPAGASASAGQSIGLEQALYGALTSNPDLVSLRQNGPATLEAVEVARQFPTTLNPTIFFNPRPIGYSPTGALFPVTQLEAYINLSIRQPIELGHQTTHRYAIARAAYDQARFTIAQAEVLALIQTYRFFQTSAYRREKLRLAEELVRFNDKLVGSLRKGLQENLVQASDLTLAEVEREAVSQAVEAARQDYASALADLQNQLGRPETAGTAEPLGEFVLPSYIPDAQDDALIRLALSTRPELDAARAAVAGARAAICLARGDQIPTIVLGPEYTRNGDGSQFAGLVFVAPLPVVNNGAPLVRQREAEARRAQVALEQLEQRTTAQVKAATAKWNAANRLVTRTAGTTDTLKANVDRMEALFQENQANLTQLLQARQRLIQLENARLDAVWQATQAQADLLTALGAPSLLSTLQSASGPSR